MQLNTIIIGALMPAISQVGNVLSQFIANQVNDGNAGVVPVYEELFPKFKDDEQIASAQNYYRDKEIKLMKVESGLNILGFLSDFSGTTGKLRAMLGVGQIVYFGIAFLNHTYRNKNEEYAEYEFHLIEHGCGNVLRGLIETITPLGNWVLILYSLAGERMKYGCEEKFEMTMISAVVPILYRKRVKLEPGDPRYVPPVLVNQQPIMAGLEVQMCGQPMSMNRGRGVAMQQSYPPPMQTWVTPPVMMQPEEQISLQPMTV